MNGTTTIDISTIDINGFKALNAEANSINAEIQKAEGTLAASKNQFAELCKAYEQTYKQHIDENNLLEVLTAVLTEANQIAEQQKTLIAEAKNGITKPISTEVIKPVPKAVAPTAQPVQQSVQPTAPIAQPVQQPIQQPIQQPVANNALGGPVSDFAAQQAPNTTPIQNVAPAAPQTANFASAPTPTTVTETGFPPLPTEVPQGPLDNPPATAIAGVTQITFGDITADEESTAKPVSAASLNAAALSQANAQVNNMTMPTETPNATQIQAAFPTNGFNPTEPNFDVLLGGTFGSN